MDHARLLLASRQAYAACADGTLGASDGSERIGWTSPPSVVVSGCNAALIGTIPEGLLIAFRGTLPPTDSVGIADWMEDIDADPESDAAYGNCSVHAGFRDGLADLWPSILPRITSLDSRVQVYITGHSMGGALAQLLGCRIRILSPTVVTFAAPMCGDVYFAALMMPLVTRYENEGDVVPTVPPLDYRPAGAQRLIWHGALSTIDYPNGWTAAVVRTLMTGEVITTHTIGPGGGYASALGA